MFRPLLNKRHCRPQYKVKRVLCFTVLLRIYRPIINLLSKVWNRRLTVSSDTSDLQLLTILDYFRCVTQPWSWTRACRRQTSIASTTFRTSTGRWPNSKRLVWLHLPERSANWRHKNLSSSQSWHERLPTTNEIGHTFAPSGWRVNVSEEKNAHTGRPYFYFGILLVSKILYDSYQCY